MNRMPTARRSAKATGKKVLVTGGAGFIGSHLVEALVQSGADVTVVDNLSTGRVENLKNVEDRIRLEVVDLVESLRLGLVTPESFDCIYHLAANSYIPLSIADPHFDFDTNLHGTFLLVEAIRRTDRRPMLVNTSSAGVYGNPTSLPIEETGPTIPISPYGVSKLAAERYVDVYCKLYGLRATSLRFSSVYGPRQRKQVVFDLLDRVRKNPRRLEILGDGSQSRDFTFVSDVVQALMLVASAAPGHGEAYNVASGETHTIAELADAVCSVCRVSPELKYTGNVRPGDAQKWAMDITALRSIGYRPKVTLEAGLRLELEWYQSEMESWSELSKVRPHVRTRPKRLTV